MRVGLLYTQVRAEERLLLDRAEELGVDVEPIWDEELAIDPHQPPAWTDDVDVVLVRTLSLHRSLALTAGLEHHGVPCVNDHATIRACGDKWQTTLALADADVPTPATRLATTSEAAREAGDGLGYPLVTKPIQGSWARGLARVHHPDGLEGVLEQRETLGHPVHHQHYLQEHVDKPGRDVRAFVAGDQVLCAIERHADHWITNTARGAEATNRELTSQLEQTCRRAAEALGGGLLAIDLMEDGEELLVHEVNATMEFRNSIEPTGTDIPARLLEHVVKRGVPA